MVHLFKRHPHARATVNINGVLLEMLQHEGEADIVEGFRELVNSGQWEVVGTSKYHAILPLLNAFETSRQIELQKKSMIEYLGVETARGFFPPEMCYSPEILQNIKHAGHEWIIASGTSVSGPWPQDHVVREPKSGVKVLFRDEAVSNRISFDRLPADAFLAHLEGAKPLDKPASYVITAMDAETFGHHIPHWEKEFLGKAYDLLQKPEHSHKIKSVTLSQIVDAFPRTEEMDPKPSSWSTTGEDLAAGVPYPLWIHPNNDLHKMQWQYLNHAIEQTQIAMSVAYTSPEAKRYADIARAVLDAAEHSCPFWWASRRPIEGLSLIYKALWLQEEVMINATRAIHSAPGQAELQAKAKKNFAEAGRVAFRLKEFLSFQV